MRESEDVNSEEAALNQLDGSGSDAEWMAIETLRREAGDRLPGLLLKKYRTASKANTRASCVFHATRYAQTSEEAIQLGREGIFDRSKIVRYQACLLLAYSQRSEVVPDLRVALSKAPIQSHEDIYAAIDAIESKNHHYFVDREHSGQVTLNIH